MAAITTVFPTRSAGVDFSTGSTIWTTATTGGETFAPSVDTYLFVRSTNPGTVTVTVTPSAGGGPSGTTIAPLALAPVIAANGSQVYGPFPPSPFASSVDGQVHISYTTVSGGNLFAYVAAINFGAS